MRSPAAAHRVGLAALAFAGAVLGSPALAEVPEDAVLADFPFLPSDERNRIYVDLAPSGGRPLPLLLDTGAAHSVLTPGAARDLGVSVRRLKRDPYRRATRVGRDLLFYVDTSSSDMGSGRGFEVGLLGGNFLEEYVVEFDFEAPRVRLLDPERYRVPEQPGGPEEAVLPLRFVSKRPVAEMEVNGERFPVLLDTGAPGTLVLDASLAERAGVKSAPSSWFRFGTWWGVVASELGQADRLAIGPFVFEQLPAVVLPNGWFNFGLPKDAVVGFDILSQFLVRIDYPRGRLWLRRRPDWAVTWNGRPWSGWPEVAAGQSGLAATSPPAIAPLADAPSLEPAREAGAAADQEVWLEVVAPEVEALREGAVDWLAVAGWAGSGTRVQHDVVVVVDVSGSTMYASGVDVDGDGKLGKARRRIDNWRTFNPRHYSSDAGDTVLAAELVATHRLLGLLDPLRTRIGLVAFSSGAQLLAPVGSDAAELERALDALDENFGAGATHVAAALELAHQALVAAGGLERRKSILVLSDGYPTAPGSARKAAAEARARAREIAAAGYRIYSFGLGLEEAEEGDVFFEIAELTGGRYTRLTTPGAVVHELPRIDLARVASVEVRNQTTGEDGRALRVFPDGSFDGFVQLAPGDNQLRFVARGSEGGQRAVERVVVYQPRPPGSEAELATQAAERASFRKLLETRALETALAAEASAGRAPPPEQQRELEVRVEKDAEDE